jgi:hypothetical protein
MDTINALRQAGLLLSMTLDLIDYLAAATPIVLLVLPPASPSVTAPRRADT